MAHAPDYDVKYTSMNPTQLANTPTAEYELMNINGRNSNPFLKIIWCTKEQYMIRGMLMAM